MVKLNRKQSVTEAKQVGKLYHAALLQKADKICDSDMLGVNGHSFFTRDKNFNIVAHHYNKVYFSVRFTVDGDKLSENYKINPINNHAEDGDIQWEVLVDHNITDFHKYVLAIDIMLDTNCFRLPKAGSWGKADANLDLVIKDPDFNKYVKVEDLLESLSSVQSYSKKYGIPLGVLNAKFSIPTIVKSLKNYSDSNSMGRDNLFKTLVSGIKTNFSRDFSIKEYADKFKIILTDKDNKNHSFVCVYNPENGSVTFVEKEGNKVLSDNSSIPFMDTWGLLLVLQELDKRIN